MTSQQQLIRILSSWTGCIAGINIDDFKVRHTATCNLTPCTKIQSSSIAECAPSCALSAVSSSGVGVVVVGTGRQTATVDYEVEVTRFASSN